MKARPATPSSIVGKATSGRRRACRLVRAGWFARPRHRWWRSLRDSLPDGRPGCATTARRRRPGAGAAAGQQPLRLAERREPQVVRVLLRAIRARPSRRRRAAAGRSRCRARPGCPEHALRAPPSKRSRMWTLSSSCAARHEAGEIGRQPPRASSPVTKPARL